ncbi:hypothetical protein FCU94_08125 [Vibrio sp. JPW-9-11-11]|uniref:hypothetical protein n=1 Tax=Vibrio sp. JPW-9-11-11 TaxID=1416532 RepID=UPI001592B0A4|nr:hypothetical protein [Vibrio sp. JPW-9-11-11]NVD06878.1 hypothetical protein [Vibrio sp. JPW-9-11-11]
MNQDMNNLTYREVTEHDGKKIVMDALNEWASAALSDHTEALNEKFHREREEINKHQYAQCTPSTWGKREELACVCLDIIDAFKNEECDEKLYVIKNETGTSVAVITLSEANDFVGRVDFEDTEDKEDKENKENPIVTITGLVKNPEYKPSILTGMTSFFTDRKINGVKIVMVASASGAGKAYTKYGFTGTRLDARHNWCNLKNKPIVCGCMLMYKAL